MSGPDYEESEINEITKLTIDARGTGVEVRARVTRPGGLGRGGAGGLSVLLARSLPGPPSACRVRYATRAVAIRFTTVRPRSRDEITRLATSARRCPRTIAPRRANRKSESRDGYRQPLARGASGDETPREIARRIERVF